MTPHGDGSSLPRAGGRRNAGLFRGIPLPAVCLLPTFRNDTFRAKSIVNTRRTEQEYHCVQASDFTSQKNGRLRRSPTGYWAFVPHPLPPRITPDWELAAALSDADRALAELAGMGRNLPNPRLLIGPLAGREAVLSSRIEGTQASLSDLFYYEADVSRKMGSAGAADVAEVLNYVHALEYGRRRISELPVSLRLIRELHERLMQGVRGENQTPGEFRRSQNWIGPPGCLLADATFVPPPPDELDGALDAFEKFIHQERKYPPLIRLALIHYQFEAIHPFLDGNGRIGRLLIILLMLHENLLPEPLLYLSAYFERLRGEYYQHLLDVSLKGRWNAWILFFLRGVAEQAADALWRVRELLNLREDYRRRLASPRTSALVPRLLDRLFLNPYVTIPGAARALEITHRAAAMNIEKLLREGLLEEVTGQQRNRVYCARGILAVCSAPSPAVQEQPAPGVARP